MIDVGRDVGAAKIELGDRVLQNFGGARRLLYRHRGHRCKTVGIFLEELFDALVVDAAPALRLFAFQIIAEKLRARIERRQRNFPLLHHLQPRFHIRQALHQRIPWTAIEGKPDGSVLIFEDFDAERFPVPLRLADYLFGNVMVMNINGVSLHMLGLSSLYCLLPDASMPRFVSCRLSSI